MLRINLDVELLLFNGGESSKVRWAKKPDTKALEGYDRSTNFLNLIITGDEKWMCLGGMYIPGQPGVVANGMMGMPQQMSPSMQVCISNELKEFTGSIYVSKLH